MPYVESGSFGFDYVIHGRAYGPEGWFVQTDWDYPVAARAVGFSLSRVQAAAECQDCGALLRWAGPCPDCVGGSDPSYPGHRPAVLTLPRRPSRSQIARHGYCDHSGTDGTVDCPDCGVPASAFIAAAGEYLSEVAR